MNDVMKNDLNLNVYACTLIGEARGEVIEGIVGCASVIRNRYQLKWMKAETYEAVCRQPSQFSCWNSDDPNLPLLVKLLGSLHNGMNLADIAYRQCYVVAKAMMDWDFKDNTKGSTHYMEASMFYSARRPAWAVNAKPNVTLGNHLFFIL